MGLEGERERFLSEAAGERGGVREGQNPTRNGARGIRGLFDAVYPEPDPGR